MAALTPPRSHRHEQRGGRAAARVVDLHHLPHRDRDRTEPVARNLPALVAVRDSKAPDGAKLMVSPETWRVFPRAYASRA
jgi:hypothetical protein